MIIVDATDANDGMPCRLLSPRRELLESDEKNFRSILRLLTGFFFWKPRVETCSCLCGARACGGGACAVQCRYGGAVDGSRVVWGAACAVREEVGAAAGGRLHTAMALLGLKVSRERVYSVVRRASTVVT